MVPFHFYCEPPEPRTEALADGGPDQASLSDQDRVLQKPAEAFSDQNQHYLDGAVALDSRDGGLAVFLQERVRRDRSAGRSDGLGGLLEEDRMPQDLQVRTHEQVLNTMAHLF